MRARLGGVWKRVCVVVPHPRLGVDGFSCSLCLCLCRIILLLSVLSPAVCIGIPVEGDQGKHWRGSHSELRCWLASSPGAPPLTLLCRERGLFAGP